MRPYLPAGLKLLDWRAPENANTTVEMNVQYGFAGNAGEGTGQLEDVARLPWLALTEVVEAGEPTIIEASKEGTVRFPEGGEISVGTLQHEDRHSWIPISCHQPEIWGAGRSLFGLAPMSPLRRSSLWVVVVDGKTNIAYFTRDLSELGSMDPLAVYNTPLWEAVRFMKLALDPLSPDQNNPSITPEILQRSTLYFFWPREVEGTRLRTLEPAPVK